MIIGYERLRALLPEDLKARVSAECIRRILKGARQTHPIGQRISGRWIFTASDVEAVEMLLRAYHRDRGRPSNADLAAGIVPLMRSKKKKVKLRAR